MKYKKVKSYYNAIEANLDRDRLLEREIPCFLTNENITTLMPNLNFIAGGGVNLMVSEEHVELARQILSEQYD